MLLAFFHQAEPGLFGQIPAYIHIIKIDFAVAQSAQGHGPQRSRAADTEYDLIRSADDFLADGAEKLKVIGARPQYRLLYHTINIPEAHIVVSRQVQIRRAALNEFRG